MSQSPIKHIKFCNSLSLCLCLSHCVGEDCFTVGRYAYNQGLWRHTRQWMLTALERFDEENGSELDIPSVYDHLAFSEYSVSLLLLVINTYRG